MVIFVLPHQVRGADISRTAPAEQPQQLIIQQQLTPHHVHLLFFLFWAQGATKCIRGMTAKQFIATAAWCVQ